MKAVLCKGFDGPDALVFDEAPPLHPGPDEVLIRTRACGINFPDGLITEGRYQIRPPLPFSPGVELAGVVHAVGAGVTRFKPGDRVVAHPEYGAFAEEVVVREGRVFTIPDAMDFSTATAFLIAYGTSQQALKDRAHLQPGETLLVLGAAGGIGLTAVELGALMGARVIAAASSDEKLALCRSRGAHETVNYAGEDLRARVKELTQGRGVDVVYDPVGGPYTEPMVRSLARNGRYLVMGFAAGEIPKIPLNLLLLKTIALVGAYWGPSIDADPARNAENLAELYRWYGDGRIHPHIAATFPLARAAEAIRFVTERKAVGKVVLTV